MHKVHIILIYHCALTFVGLIFHGLLVFTIFEFCDVIVQALSVWSKFLRDETFINGYWSLKTVKVKAYTVLVMLNYLISRWSYWDLRLRLSATYLYTMQWNFHLMILCHVLQLPQTTIQTHIIVYMELMVSGSIVILNTNPTTKHALYHWTRPVPLNTLCTTEHTLYHWTHSVSLNALCITEHTLYHWTHPVSLNTPGITEHTLYHWTHSVSLNTPCITEHTLYYRTHSVLPNTPCITEHALYHWTHCITKHALYHWTHSVLPNTHCITEHTLYY